MKSLLFLCILSIQFIQISCSDTSKPSSPSSLSSFSDIHSSDSQEPNSTTSTLSSTTGSGSIWSANNSLLDTYISNERIGDIVIDANNVLYVGSYGGGLSVFDGTQWTNYNVSNSILQSNAITNMAIDADQNIWMIGLHSVYTFKDGVFTSINLPNGIFPKYNPSDSISLNVMNISDIVVDSNGAVWFSHYSLAFSRYANSEWTLFKSPIKNNDSEDNIPSYTSWNMDVDSEGTLWAANTEKGIWKFNGKEFEVFDSMQIDDEHMNLDMLEVTKNGDIWAAYFHGEIVRFSNGRRFEYSLNTEDYDCLIENLQETPQGTIIVSCQPYLDKFLSDHKKHFYEFKNEEWQESSTIPDITIPSPSTIIFHNDSPALLGSSYGLFANENGTWTKFHAKNNILFDPMLIIETSANNSVWLISKNSTSIFNQSHWKHYPQKYSINIYIADLIPFEDGFQALDEFGMLYNLSDTGWAEDTQLPQSAIRGSKNRINIGKATKCNDGSLWIASKNNGIIHIINESREEFNTENSPFESNYFSHISCSPDGTIWTSTLAGISSTNYFYEDSEWHKLEKAPLLLKGQKVASIHSDNQEGIWFSTEEKGLFRYKNNIWHNLNPPINNCPFSSNMIFDKANTMYWVSEYSNAICSYDGAVFRTGPNNGATISLDSSGTIWFGNNYESYTDYHQLKRIIQDSIEIYTSNIKMIIENNIWTDSAYIDIEDYPIEVTH